MTFDPVHLSAKALAVRRGEGIVVSNVSFAVGPGDALALRGANGAGKTSLLRGVAGFSAIAKGDLAFRLNGAPADLDEARSVLVHYLGHAAGVKTSLTARENGRFWADLFGGGAVDAALTRLGLGGLAASPASIFSAGQKQRLALCRLLIAPRPVWLLDEPSAALDIEGRRLLNMLIAEHRRQGGIVLLATHDANDVPEASVLRVGDGVLSKGVAA
ncbi:MAG: heme ABC exporter ATP-binding protein CcmA [Pseudomonadota bacterium]